MPCSASTSARTDVTSTSSAASAAATGDERGRDDEAPHVEPNTTGSTRLAITRTRCWQTPSQPGQV